MEILYYFCGLAFIPFLMICVSFGIRDILRELGEYYEPRTAARTPQRPFAPVRTADLSPLG